MNRIGTYLLLTVVFLTIAAPAFCDKAEDLVNRGITKQAKGDWDGAIADYTQAIALNPNIADAYYGRGDSYLAKGDLDAAIADTTRAIEINPFLAVAYCVRGTAKLAKGDPDGSISDTTKAIQFNSLYASAYYVRGDARLAKNDTEGAIADLTKAIELKPDYAEAYANRGAAKGAKGDLDGALADSNKALQLKPDLAAALANRGAVKSGDVPPPSPSPGEGSVEPQEAAASSAPTRQTSPRTLDEVLQRLEDNLLRYHSTIPSFFCDEHAVSSLLSAYTHKAGGTTTDSLFRLKRIPNPDQTTTLTESRDVKTVNGHPANGEDISGPSIVRGAFSGGLSIVSLSQKACMRYKLRPIKSGQPYVVEFTSNPAAERPSNCLLQEDGSGRVFIDPATMEIKRIELTAPHHTIVPAGKTSNGYNIPPIIGVWYLAIDYTPIQLDRRTFWMPATIDSTGTAGYIADKTVWSFKATYRNYHKLEVTSRILPGYKRTENPK